MSTRRQRQILRNRKIEFERKVEENMKKAKKAEKKEEPKKAEKKEEVKIVNKKKTTKKDEK